MQVDSYQANKWGRSRSILWKFLDLVYPPKCCNCGRIGYHFCPECWSEIHTIKDPICRVCGIPLMKNSICLNCKTEPLAVDSIRSFGIYTGSLRQAIQRIKYSRDYSLAVMFIEPLLELVNQQNWTIDIIIPVPLSAKRKRTRGYNQASWLAKPFAKSLMKPFSPEGLVRVKETKSQVGLSFKERKINVAGAFSANSDIVNSRNILLVDDVITTGATLQACAVSLKKAGAVKVYGITIARTMNILDDFQIQ